MYPPSALIPDNHLDLPDTTTAHVAYIGQFQRGYRVLRRDGKMGLLHQNLRLRVPFRYVDVQEVPTGPNPDTDFVLIARRSPYGRYATIDDQTWEPTSDFVLSYNPRLRIYGDYMVDNPELDQFFIWHRDGRAAGNEAYSTVYSYPALMTNGHRVLTVGQRGNKRRVALFNLDSARVVTPFSYRTINAVEPVLAPRTHIPLLEGLTPYGLRLLRPDGRELSDRYFAGVEDYNNWKQLRTFFGLEDDPRAQAIAWTVDMDVYVVYDDDSVVYIGRYLGN